MSKPIRLRFAPSPTGPLHIGGVRSALYNYLFAKKQGGQFILRIEDTDQTRYVDGAEKYIIDALNWIGISPDESPAIGGPYSPYRQSERKELGYYKTYADKLVATGKAYYAFDSAEELDNMRKKLEAEKAEIQQYSHINRLHMRNSLSLPESEWKNLISNGTPYVIRLKVDPGQTLVLNDLIRGRVEFKSEIVDDKVLIKADGMPTYHLAHIVDDILMKISHVVRGEEWLPSFPAHLLIYRYLNLEGEMPLHAHLPLLLKPDGHGKLSKRDGDRLGFPVFPLQWTDPVSGEVSSGFREQGYESQALVNCLALLGWHHTGEQELFSMDELIHNFSFEHVHKGGARFDPEKAKWFNEQYVRALDAMDIWLKAIPEFAKHKLLGTHKVQYFIKAISLIKDRITFAADVVDKNLYLYRRPDYSPATIATLKNPLENGLLKNFTGTLYKADFADKTVLDQTLKHFATEHSLKTGDFMKFIRVCLVGELSGPALPDLMHLFGKRETIARIERGYYFHFTH